MALKRLVFFSLLVVLVLLTSPAMAQSNQHIAVIASFDSPANNALIEGFRSHLAGQELPLSIEVHNLEMSADLATSIVAQLRSQKPNLILALGSLAVQSIGENLPEIPAIASMVVDKEIIRQYHNMSGVALGFPLKEQVAWLKKILPQAKHVGVLSSTEFNDSRIGAMAKLMKRKGLVLHPRKISDPNQILPALKQMESQADVLWGLSDSMVLNPQTAKTFLLFSLRNKIPFIGLSAAWVKAGALYALERDYRDIGRQCAQMAIHSLSGKAIQSIEIETPRVVQYELNLKIAARMRINLAEEIIAGATRRY